MQYKNKFFQQMFEMPAIFLIGNSWSSWIANFSTISTTTTIPSPSQILPIFSSEPPQNPRPFKHGQLFKKYSYLQGLDKKNIFEKMRISRLLERENYENVARTRNCCGWHSSPRSSQTYMLRFLSLQIPLLIFCRFPK